MFGLGLFTLVVRRCGTCNRVLGVAVWRWSGRLWVETHGYCDDCFAQLGAEIQASEDRLAAGDAAAPARRRPRRRLKTAGARRPRLRTATGSPNARS